MSVRINTLSEEFEAVAFHDPDGVCGSNGELSGIPGRKK